MKRTLTTAEAATVLGHPPGSFHRWATTHLHVQPLRRIRIGRSTVTVWSVQALTDATQRLYAGQMNAGRAEISNLDEPVPDLAQPSDDATRGR